MRCSLARTGGDGTVRSMRELLILALPALLRSGTNTLPNSHVEFVDVNRNAAGLRFSGQSMARKSHPEMKKRLGFDIPSP